MSSAATEPAAAAAGEREDFQRIGDYGLLADLGLDTVGIEPGRGGIAVDTRMRAGDGPCGIGDVTGIWPLTCDGEYRGRAAAANIRRRRRDADYTAVSRVVFTDPQIAAVGEVDEPVTATVPLAEV